MKKVKIAPISLITVFLIIIMTIPLFSLVDQDKGISNLENRTLSKFPLINKTKLLSGEFFKKLETYNTDQIYLRDNLVEIYSMIQTKIFKKREVNGYLLGKDGFLLPYKQYITQNAYNNIPENYAYGVINALVDLQNAAKTYNGELYYLYIPHKVDMYYDKYPDFYENRHKYYEKVTSIKMSNAEKAGINIIDTTNVLEKAKKANEYIYFKTDHHYTFKGAYYCYKELLKVLNGNHPKWNLQYLEWNEMNVTRVNKTFVGSYMSQMGDTSDNKGDYLEYALPNDYPKFERYEYGKKYKNTIFRDGGDSVGYGYILGDNANTVIKTNRKELPNILIIGASYTNDLEAMAVYNFNEMHSIDPRHWKGNISEYIKKTKPDVVVVVRDDLYEGNKGNIAKIK